MDAQKFKVKFHLLKAYLIKFWKKKKMTFFKFVFYNYENWFINKKGRNRKKINLNIIK